MLLRNVQSDETSMMNDRRSTGDDECHNSPPFHHPPLSSSAALRLLQLLLRCAEAVGSHRMEVALDLLPDLYELSSPFGSPPQRIAAYFSDALRSRIYSTLLLPTADHNYHTLLRNHHVRISHAFHCLNSITPLLKFSHFTSNHAILHSLSTQHDRLHVIDLDIMQGLQWPALFHLLTSAAPNIRSLRITAMGSPLDRLHATGRRLSDFAAVLGLPFEYHSVDSKIGTMDDPAGLRHRGEVTVVQWVQHGLYDVAGSDVGAIGTFRALKPELITIVEQDLGLEGESFMGRFMEALRYYSAMFDALGEGGGDGREVVERHVLGGEIRSIVLGRRGGEGGVGRWREEMGRAGFERVSLAGSPATQANLLLGMYPWKGYTLAEEAGCLRLGWKDLPLLTASAWRPSPELLAEATAPTHHLQSPSFFEVNDGDVASSNRSPPEERVFPCV